MPKTPIAELYESRGRLVRAVAEREQRGYVTFTVEDLNQAIWLAIHAQVARVAGFGTIELIEFSRRAANDYKERERTDYLNFVGLAND